MPSFDDLQGSLHAGVLLFLPLLTVGLIFSFPAPAERENRMRALGYSTLLTLVFLLVGLMKYRQGWPLMQIVIPVACLWAAVYIGSPVLNKAVCYIILLVGIGMISWYAILIDMPYVGKAGWTGQREQELDHMLGAAKKAFLDYGAADEVPYDPGFANLENTLLYNTYHDHLPKDVALVIPLERSRPLWHTWITRLYARRLGHLAIYYPGGRVIEAAPRMEWREVPAP